MKRRARGEAKLNNLIPARCKYPPGAPFQNLWYGIVRYKDELTGNTTETIFDNRLRRNK